MLKGSFYRDMKRGGWNGSIKINGKRKTVHAKTRKETQTKLINLIKENEEGNNGTR